MSTTEQPAAPLDTLVKSARTVTGNNLKGTVRVLSRAEIGGALAALQRDLAAAHAAELARQRNEYEARLKQLEGDLLAARQLGESEVAKVRGACDQRIKELEEALARDDVRQQLARMEQEVARLRALVDRYEAGLDFVTSVEAPDFAADLALAQALSSRVGKVLRLRLDAIIAELEAAEKGISDSLDLINRQGRGSLYGVTDLMVRVVRVRSLHSELLSIQQALDAA